MTRFSFTVLACCAFSALMANTSPTDSLMKVFISEKDDSLKMELAFELATFYLNAKEIDTSIAYLDIAIDKAKTLGFPLLLHEFTLSKAQFYTRLGHKEEALAMTDTAEATALKIGNTYNKLECMILRGNIYSQFGFYSEAIYAFKAVVEQAKEARLDIWTATALNNLSLEYQSLGDEESCIEYLMQSIKIRENTNSTYLGTSYANLANTYKRQKRLEEAVEWYEKALILLEGDAYIRNRKVCLRNLGDTYAQLGKYNKARKLLKEAYNLALLGRQDPIELAMYYFLTGSMHFNNEIYDSTLINGKRVVEMASENVHPIIRSSNLINMAKASSLLAELRSEKEQQYMKQALEYGEQAMTLANQTGSYPQINKLAKVLMGIYGKTDNAEKTLEYAELYGNSLDSLNKIEQNKRVIAQQTKFELEKKEFQIDLLQKETELSKVKIDEAQRENEVQLYYLALIGLALAIFIAFAVLLYGQVKLKKRANDELLKKNETISQQNEEKELLLKEIHHRVKNNLQVVSSLLDLQSKKADDGEKAALAEGQSRVRAMALIHEKLYQSKSVSEINFEEYCTQLSQQISQLFPNGKSVNCHIEVIDVSLDIDTAIPVGLILNELITNAYKYAFPEGGGSLKISAKKGEENGYILRVEDDGKGLPENFDWRKSKSLGLRLVNRLARQLYGTSEYTNSDMSAFEITFKDSIERKKVA